jgi:hypothetical protein
MWIRWSEVLAPLSKLTSKTTKWQWTEVKQKAFEMIKCIILWETLLAYPDFNKPFIIHTDAGHTRLGAVISHDNKLIAFYSQKLNPAQTWYMTMEHELLSIIKTLKEFRNILLGQHIKVYTDHQNLTYANFNTECIMRWWLIIEEFSPELIYLKGKTNIMANALTLSFWGTTFCSPVRIHRPKICIAITMMIHMAIMLDYTPNSFPVTSVVQNASSVSPSPC